MGNFAQQVHPLVDSVELTVLRVNSTVNDTFSVRILNSKFLNLILIFSPLYSFPTVHALDQPRRTLPTRHHIELTTV